MLITNVDGNILNDTFFDLASKAEKITIASGYFGASQIEDTKPLFLEIAKKGGEINLIHGMGMWEGVKNKLENTIASLNNDLQKISPQSGFYFHIKQRFHGKIYLFENAVSQTCIVGSSNFSKNGVSSNLEANLLQTDKKNVALISKFLELLLKQSLIYKANLLPIRGIKKSSQNKFNKKPKDNYQLPKDISLRPVDFILPVRTEPKSNINITFGKGRYVREKDINIPRPYYEMEITIPKDFVQKPLINFLPNQNDPARFDVFTDNNLYFEAVFKNKVNTLHTPGIDFMSSPREALGKFIKDKLIASGIIEYGDFITDDDLFEYGSNKLRFKKLEGNRLYLEF